MPEYQDETFLRRGDIFSTDFSYLICDGGPHQNQTSFNDYPKKYIVFNVDDDHYTLLELPSIHNLNPVKSPFKVLFHDKKYLGRRKEENRDLDQLFSEKVHLDKVVEFLFEEFNTKAKEFRKKLCKEFKEEEEDAIKRLRRLRLKIKKVVEI